MCTQTTLRNNRDCLVGEFGHVAAAAARFARSSHTDEGGGSDRGDRGRDARNDSSSGSETTERGRRKVTTAENEDDTAQRRRKRGEKKSSRNTTGGEISLSPGFYFAIFFFRKFLRALASSLFREHCVVCAACTRTLRFSHAAAAPTLLPDNGRTDGRTPGRSAEFPIFLLVTIRVCVCICRCNTRFSAFQFCRFLCTPKMSIKPHNS